MFRPGERVRVITEYWRGKDQRGTVLEYGKRIRGMAKVRLDNIQRKKIRLYHRTSLEHLHALEILGEQAE